MTNYVTEIDDTDGLKCFKKLKILFYQVYIKLQNKENYKSYFVFFPKQIFHIIFHIFCIFRQLTDKISVSIISNAWGVYHNDILACFSLI